MGVVYATLRMGVPVQPTPGVRVVLLEEKWTLGSGEPVTPTDAPDADLPAPEELPPSPDSPDTPVVDDDDADAA